jgi:hypothetical protein
MKGQKKEHSALEVGLSVVIGYIVAVSAQILIFPFFGIYISPFQNMLMATFFTVVSVVRQYYVRRLFNWLHVKELL